MAEVNHSREWLIWQIAINVAAAEGKPLVPGTGMKRTYDRAYVLDLVAAARLAVDPLPS